MTARAVLYARTSGDDRGKNNIDAQLEACRQYAKGKGYAIVQELKEDERGASGALENLPGRDKAIELAEDHAYDVLVVRDADRLARDEAVFHILAREITRAGVRIESTTEGPLASPEGEQGDEGELGGLFAWVAARERKRIARRTKVGRRNRVARGGVMVAGRAPYGYLAERQGDSEHGLFCLKPHNPEATTVRQIFGWFTSGQLDINGIARKLSTNGVPTPADVNPLKGGSTKKRPRGEWCRQTVHRILKNETYSGTWTYGKRIGAKKGQSARSNPTENWLTVDVPALVDRNVWEAAQERLEINRRNGNRPKKNFYLLGNGRLRCGVCQSAMHGTAGGRGSEFLYYRCGAKKPLDYARKCDSKMVRAELVDAAVWGWVEGILSDPASFEEGLTAYRGEQMRQAEPLRERGETLDDLIAEHEAQLNRLLDLYLAGQFERDVLAERKARIESTLASLRAERQDLMDALEGQVMSDDTLHRLQAFARDLAANVEKASRNLKVRRKVIEALDVRATLQGRDLLVRCAVGGEVISAETSTQSGMSRLTESKDWPSMTS
jgi:site-specific DNA recombinase